MMRGRIVVFPIKGRKWCFSRSVDQTTIDTKSAYIPSTFKQLYEKLKLLSSSSYSPSADNSSANKPTESKTELIIDFFSNKMNRAWAALEKAPPDSFKSKLHGLGVRLLSRVEPSEIFLKSISKEVTGVDVTFPSSLNARLVRRRLRHIAQRGTIIHRKYFYGSVVLLPITTIFTVLPLPNIPFFWVLFRSYSHWIALKGSERLLLLASDCSATNSFSIATSSESKSSDDVSENKVQNPTWMLQPSEELEQLVQKVDPQTGLNDCIVSKICKIYDLNTMDVIKYRNMT